MKLRSFYLFIIFTIIILLVYVVCETPRLNLISNPELDLATLPVLHEGRIKPFDSYARLTLKSFSNKENINNQSASKWLFGLLLNPRKDYDNKIFTIHNPEVKQALGLTGSNYYSFKEILPGIKQNMNLLTQLSEISEANPDNFNMLTPAEQQLLVLYKNTLSYFDLSRSLSLLLPEFKTEQLNLITKNTGKIINRDLISYYQILPYRNLIIQELASIRNTNNLNNPDTTNILNFAKQFKNLETDRININLKLIPDLENNNWTAPWEIIVANKGTPTTAQYLNLLQKVVYGEASAKNLKELALTLISINNNILITEYYYNKFKLPSKSLLLYILAFFMTVILLYNYKKYSWLALIIFSAGVLLHLLNLGMRIYILQRPPVANLYESILFVGLIVGIFSIIIELKRKDYIGILLGSLICTSLQFIANSYATTGDSLGVLIAVLNNNFWLGTHVIAVTSGYGACLILSALSHIYLFTNCLYSRQKSKLFEQIKQKLTQLFQYILTLSLIALFLMLLGTILGGIWADQSWGRFWGWDPKENGALLICLWLISLLHGRISGQLREITFVAAAAFTSVTVALAWFGVNLLSTGLHSYGFTENIATNLILFIIFEILLIFGLVYINYKKQTHHYEN
ncbi:MAG: cytochrome c biogenesis protein CcsA [Gammaproteobacteria bacterium]|nr:cytochrome c biogenesis protein CcsA [Gammaproteobacteria bacterium]